MTSSSVTSVSVHSRPPPGRGPSSQSPSSHSPPTRSPSLRVADAATTCGRSSTRARATASDVASCASGRVAVPRNLSAKVPPRLLPPCSRSILMFAPMPVRWSSTPRSSMAPICDVKVSVHCAASSPITPRRFATAHRPTPGAWSSTRLSRPVDRCTACARFKSSSQARRTRSADASGGSDRDRKSRYVSRQNPPRFSPASPASVTRWISSTSLASVRTLRRWTRTDGAPGPFAFVEAMVPSRICGSPSGTSRGSSRSTSAGSLPTE
mmetsp:Transcript_3230/g.9263  ORF Transcript_3230/g.9263 Transcript_3230/m.9263 type:complete len:267 (-) Transcript_3230:2061-2861(-)